MSTEEANDYKEKQTIKKSDKELLRERQSITETQQGSPSLKRKGDDVHSIHLIKRGRNTWSAVLVIAIATKDS